MKLSVKQNRTVSRGGLAMLCFLLSMVLAGCSTTQEETVTMSPKAGLAEEQTEVPTEMPIESSYEFVNVSCIRLKVPEELSEYLVHEQSIYGKSVTESFYMKGGEKDIPLYRIDVGDETLGDWLGMLKTENGNVPITYTVFAVTDEQLTALGEGASDTYAELMNAFNVMMEDILNDERFTTEKPLAVGENGEVQMTYWKVMLPSNMSYAETMENGNYHAVFSGEVRGEKVDLYCVRIGDILAKTELGLFSIDGVAKPVSIESYDIAERATWNDDDYSAAYRMMDTINDVIETIMSSAQFSIPSEEFGQAPDTVQ